MPGSPSWPASVVSCAARPERITSPPSRVARDGLSGIGSAARRTITRARTPAATSISSSNSSGRSGSGSGAGSVTSCAPSPGSSSHSCARRVLEHRAQLHELADQPPQPRVRRRPPGRQRHGDARPGRDPARAPRAGSSRTCTYAYGSSPPDGKNHDSTRRPSRTPSSRPPPCASHTSRSPRPNSPRWPPASGSTPSAPSRRSTAAASIPIAVVGAAQLVAPIQQRRRAQPPHRPLATRRERRVGRARSAARSAPTAGRRARSPRPRWSPTPG